MSLNDAERRRTADELQQALQHCGLSADVVATDLGFSRERLTGVLNLNGEQNPVDVWQLRDYLQQAALDQGLTPTRFSVLTESARRAARQWFQLRAAPRHEF